MIRWRFTLGMDAITWRTSPACVRASPGNNRSRQSDSKRSNDSQSFCTNSIFASKTTEPMDIAFSAKPGDLPLRVAARGLLNLRNDGRKRRAVENVFANLRVTDKSERFR